MKQIALCWLVSLIGGCANMPPPAQIATDSPIPIKIKFACPPKGTNVEFLADNGDKFNTMMLGADPLNPDICLQTNSAALARGRPPIRQYFNLWGESAFVLSGDEYRQARQNMTLLETGQSRHTQVKLRSDNQEVTHQWSVLGREKLLIDRREVDVVHIRISYIYSANGGKTIPTRDIWIDPERNVPLRVKLGGASQIFGHNSWQAIKYEFPAL